MTKIKLDYEEKKHILEVDGKEYAVPQRTPKTAELLKKHDENITQMSEYESNISLLEIYFGTKSVKTMFPDKENTNLDKLSECARVATALYMADYERIQMENIKEKMDAVKPVIDNISAASALIDKANTKKQVNKKRK